MKSKITFILMLVILPVMQFMGNMAFAQTVSGTTSNLGCVNSGIVNATSTGLGATPQYQLLKAGVVVAPVPNDPGQFTTNPSFTGLSTDTYTLNARATVGGTIYSSAVINVTDGYVVMTVATPIKRVGCVGGTASLSSTVTAGKAPFVFSIATQAAPLVPLQTSGSISASTFDFNVLPVNSYIISVTDGCGQTVTGSTSISNPTVSVNGIKLGSNAYPQYVTPFNCSTPIQLYNELGFQYVSDNTSISPIDAANFTWKVKYLGQLYGKDIDSDGYSDVGGAGYSPLDLTIRMPLIATRAGIEANLSTMRVVLSDNCGNSKEFPVVVYYSSINTSNCGGSGLVQTVSTQLACFPIAITYTNINNASDVIVKSKTEFVDVSGGFTPGATYHVTYRDAAGYTTGNFVDLPANQNVRIPPLPLITITQDFFGVQPNLDVLGYGKFALDVSPYKKGDVITYTITSSTNPKAPVGYVGSYELGDYQTFLLPSVNASDPEENWPKGNYTLSVTTPCGTTSVNGVVQGYVATLSGNTVTPVCGGFNYVMNGTFDSASAYQVLIVSGPSGIGQVRDLASTSASLPFNGLSYGTYVFALRIKGGTTNIFTQTVTYDANNVITVNKTNTGGYVCTVGATDGILTIAATTNLPAPDNVLQYALSTDGGSTYGAFQASNVFANLATGTYYFQVKDGCGNVITQTAQIGVAVSPTATANGQSSPAEVCGISSGTIQLDVDILGASSYLWTGPGITIGNQALKNPVINYSNLLPGVNNFTCLVTLGLPCNTANLANLVITVTPIPNVVVTNPLAICSPNTVNITAPAVTLGSTPGLTYSYFSDSAGTIPLTNAAAITTSGTYYIKGTSGTCSTLAPVTVTINDFPITTISYLSDPYCNRGTAVASLTGVTGGTYSGDVGLIIDPLTGLIDLAASTTGGHRVTYTYSSCLNTTTFDITINATTLPAAIPNVIGQCSVSLTPPTVVDACSGTITATTPTVFPITTIGTTVVAWLFDYGNGFTQTVNQNVIITVNDCKITAVKSIVGNPSVVNRGDILTYNITLTNTSNTIKTGLSIVDVVPSSLNTITAISNSGVRTGNTINWTNLTVAANSSLVLSFKATVPYDLVLSVLNVKNVATIIDPIDPGNPLTPEIDVPIVPLGCGDNAQLKLTGDASLSPGGYIQLTANIGHQSGQAWSYSELSLNNDFDLQFRAFFGADPGGADGFAFVMKSLDAANVGLVGGGIGYGGIGSNGHGHSFIVEFDTFYNQLVPEVGGVPTDDTTQDHSSFQTSGDFSLAGRVGPEAKLGNIKDAKWHDVRIRWTVGTKLLEVFLNGVLINSVTRDLVGIDFAGNPLINYGYTSSTGGFRNEHAVCIQSVTTCLAGLTAPVLSSTAEQNTCPGTTFNLNSLITSPTPPGSSLVWYTDVYHQNPGYPTPNAAVGGTYYAFYYDAVANCYSPGTVAVVVKDCKITSTKTIVGNPVTVNQGDVLTYNITLKNDVNVVKTGVNVSDDIPTSLVNITNISNGGLLTGNKIDWTNITVPAKASVVLSFTGTVDSNLPAGINSIKNIAIVIDPIDPANPQKPEIDVQVGPNPGLSILKEGKFIDSDGDGKTNVGDQIAYNFVVKNTGNTVLTNITVTDINAVITGGPIASLAIGATDTATFTGIHTVTQADIDAGVVYNLATAKGTPPSGPDVTATSTDPTPCVSCPVDPTCPDCTITVLVPNPGIAITKTGVFVDSNGDGKTSVGDKVTYSFVITNTGNTILNGIIIVDNNADITGGPLASLAIGASDSSTFTAVHTITQNDIDTGFVYNLSTVTGTPPSGPDVSGTSTDPLPCATCPINPTCPDCTVVPLVQEPGISITKQGLFVDGNGDGITNVGDQVEYTFVVKNTGNTTLTNIFITDNKATISGGPLASLAVGASDSGTFTGLYTVTQADIDAGFVYNLAIANGKPPIGPDVTDTSTDPTPCATCPVDPTCPDCTITPLLQSPGISVTKQGVFIDANGDGITNIGDKIEYTFVVSNTGNTVLTNITLTDIKATISGGPIATLGVGDTDSSTFTAEYFVTQADIDAGVVYNLATVTGTPPIGPDVNGTSTDPTPCTTCPVDPTCPDCTITPLIQTPGISVTKEGVFVDVDADGRTTLGDRVEYTFVITNTGNTVLTNITVTDNNAVVTGGPLATLGVGDTDSTTFTAIHTITQADIDAEVVYNLATVTGTPPTGPDVTGTSTDPTPCTTCPVDPTCPDCTITPLIPTPGISVNKSGQFVDSNNNGITNVGDWVEYSFIVKNTGNSPLTNVTLSDPRAVITGGPIPLLDIGETDTSTFTAVHVVTQLDIDAGVVFNLATVTGTPPTGPDVSATSTDLTPCPTCPVDPTCPDCTVTPLVQDPSISVTKDGTYTDSNADGKTSVGDIVEYVFVVTNTGNTILTNIVITDNNVTVTGGPLASLAVGQKDFTTFKATHVVTQADIDAGAVYNLAIVTATSPSGPDVSDTSTDPTPCTTCPVDPTCPDCTVTPLIQDPSVSITKDGVFVDSNGDGKTSVGDTVQYTFVVTNTGNTTLTNVTVTDNNAVVTGGPLASLAVGAVDSTTFTATHSITQADIDAGQVYNLALATVTPPIGPDIVEPSTDPTPCTTCPIDPVCPDCTITPLTPTSGISITKHGTFVDNNADGLTNVGDTVEYTFVVTNTGNTTLTNITVTDNNAVVTGGPLASLAVGAVDSTTFTAIHTITQIDIDAGQVYNLALATATPPIGPDIVEPSTDPAPCMTCPVDPTCPDCTITPLIQDPGVSITKDGVFVDSNGDGKTSVGDTVEYTFVVTNTGNTTLTNVIVTDNNAVVTGGPLASLAVGAVDSTTFTAIHIVTQADIDAGQVYNLALATVTPPIGPDIIEPSTDPTPCTTCPIDPVCPDCTITPLTPTSEISITKHGAFVDNNADGVTSVGDTVEYTFVVTNTGNTTLTNITVTDNNAVVKGGPLASLAVGAVDSTTFTAIHIITQADIDAGEVYNLALANVKPPIGPDIIEPSTDPLPCTTCPVDPTCPDCTITPLVQDPGISITKHGLFVDNNADGITNVGDTVEYTFVVTNTGNTTLTNVTVTDNNAVITGGPLAILAVGEVDSTTFKGVHVITQADIDKGDVYNLATIIAKDPNGADVPATSTDPLPCTTCPVDPICPDCTITPLTPNSGISITKHDVFVDSNGDGLTNVGDRVEYAFVVTNTGNTTLTNITVNDDNALVTGGPLASLAVGAVDATTFKAVHILTQADIDAGLVYNLAIAAATPPNGPDITEPSTDPLPCTTCPIDPVCPDCTITPLTPNSSIAIIKKATFTDENKDGYTQVGETIKYTFEIKNTGQTSLTNVTVTDNLPGLILSGGPINLAVGEVNSTSFTGVYTITQADINRGSVTNQATAEGTTPSGAKVTDLSDNDNFTGDSSTVIDITDCVIEVFNAVSPNADGFNDVFTIKGLECYPNNTVEIYNRWGVKVFETNNYNSNGNVFEGYSDGRATVSRSEILPDGTYFYTLKYQDNTSAWHSKSGYLYINK